MTSSVWSVNRRYGLGEYFDNETTCWVQDVSEISHSDLLPAGCTLGRGGTECLFVSAGI